VHYSPGVHTGHIMPGTSLSPLLSLSTSSLVLLSVSTTTTTTTTPSIFLAKLAHLLHSSHEAFSALGTVMQNNSNKSNFTARYILFEVCFQPRLRPRTASRINGQWQLVQRGTTIAEVIVWQQFNTGQLQIITANSITTPRATQSCHQFSLLIAYACKFCCWLT